MSQSRFPPLTNRFKSFLNVRKFIRDPFPLLDQAIGRFGKTYSFYMGGVQKAVLTVDPEAIRQLLQKHHRLYEKSSIVTDILARYIGKGLLTATGDQWLRQRRLIQPGFHRKRIESLESLMRLEIDACMRRWDETAKAGQSLDAYQEMNKLTFSIVARTLFSSSLEESGLHRLSNLISTIQEFIIREVRQPFKRWWYRLSGQTSHHVRLALSARELIRDNIRMRQQATAQPDDLLTMLLETRYEDTGLPMEEEQLIDECLILFVAGHETSANALSWMIYLLGKHRPEWIRLREADQAERPVRIRNVILETLRLYPPAWVIDRVSLAEDQILQYHLPKGTTWIVYIRGMHRQADHFHDPDAFIPDRWDEPDIYREAFLPFGSGPRLCIGEHFAMMEMQLILEAIVDRWDFVLLTGDIKEKALVTLRPDKAVQIRLAAR